MQRYGYNRRAPGKTGRNTGNSGVKGSHLKQDLNLKMACKRMLRGLSSQSVSFHNAAVQLVAALSMVFRQAPFLTTRKIA